MIDYNGTTLTIENPDKTKKITISFIEEGQELGVKIESAPQVTEPTGEFYIHLAETIMGLIAGPGAQPVEQAEALVEDATVVE